MVRKNLHFDYLDCHIELIYDELELESPIIHSVIITGSPEQLIKTFDFKHFLKQIKEND